MKFIACIIWAGVKLASAVGVIAIVAVFWDLLTEVSFVNEIGRGPIKLFLHNLETAFLAALSGDAETNVPEFLFAEIEQQVLNVIFNTIKIPSEDADNKQNINR